MQGEQIEDGGVDQMIILNWIL